MIKNIRELWTVLISQKYFKGYWYLHNWVPALFAHLILQICLFWILDLIPMLFFRVLLEALFCLWTQFCTQEMMLTAIRFHYQGLMLSTLCMLLAHKCPTRLHLSCKSSFIVSLCLSLRIYYSPMSLFGAHVQVLAGMTYPSAADTPI